MEKSFSKILSASIFLALSVFAMSACNSGISCASFEKSDDGTIKLFNGEDLDGWYT